ncbi:Pathoproteinsis-related homeodomain protein [Hibiscus syriacus]|uniref:Pathoproteinsis-related homeodomain protein n=1 Tax=Hibiscus syriacus TaxID=106335 RepID=A0A6A3CZ09_HIBSY|nr:Pathoproteinsis-related homeodomain protein [Hibiscus syriacus]
MHGTGNKLTDHGPVKSYSSKREDGSKLIATLKLKNLCKLSHGRVRKPKHHVKKVGSSLLKRKVTASVTKGLRSDVSYSKKVGCKTNLHKANKKGSSKKSGSSKLQGKNATHGSLEENGKKANADVRIKKLTKKTKKGKKDKVELDEASRLQRRTKYLLIKMKLEQNLIDAYSGEGWKGQSREKIKPEKELQRAKKQILKCKLGIRETIRQLDSLSSVGSIEGSVIAPDGSVYHEHIFCAKCKLREAFPDNDIVLCDGTCNQAFHQKCLDPPLDTENIPPVDQGWLCKFCECKIAIIEAMNAHIGTHFSVDSHWQDIFKDEAALPDDAITSLNPEDKWPSDDSDDDDYKPGRRENSFRISDTATDGNESDDTDSSTSLSCDGEIVWGRRRRRAVDYKKLYDEMFGKDAPQYEQVSEDEDWGPEMKRQLPSELKSRQPFFRIPPTAVEKLRQVFAENELPSRVIRENLSKELGLEPEKVNKWFKNARYLALKSRKVEKADHLQSSSPTVTKETGLQAPKRNNPDAIALEDMSETALLRTPKRLKKKLWKSPNSKSNSNKVSKELSDDVILKKLLNVKKRKRKRKNIFVGGGLQAFELEMERLCRLRLGLRI